MRPSRLLFISAAVLALLPTVIYACERFMRQDLKFSLNESYFGRHPGALLGMQPDMMPIARSCFLVLLAFLIIFFFRRDLDVFTQHRVLAGRRGTAQRGLNHLANFLTDEPVRLRWFHAVGEWAVVFFLRGPGLVLMYSATNDSLVMPSYPLEPTSATFFKFFQVLLGVLMLTQTALPVAGALVIGTWIYLWRGGWLWAAAVVSVVALAAVLYTSPCPSHQRGP